MNLSKRSRSDFSGRIVGRFVHSISVGRKKKESEREKWEEGSEDTRKGEV